MQEVAAGFLFYYLHMFEDYLISQHRALPSTADHGQRLARSQGQTQDAKAGKRDQQ